MLDEFGFVPPEHLAAITKVEGSARPASSICFAKLCFMLSQFGGLGLRSQRVFDDFGGQVCKTICFLSRPNCENCTPLSQ